MLHQDRPPGIPQDNDCNLPLSKILLVTEILVGSEEYLEARPLSGREEFAIRKLRPAVVTAKLYCVRHKRARQTTGYTLIEKDSH